MLMRETPPPEEEEKKTWGGMTKNHRVHNAGMPFPKS